MNDDLQQEGTPEESPSQETEAELDVGSFSDEDLDRLIEGTPDEANVQQSTQPESEVTEQVVEPEEAAPREVPVDYEKLKARAEEQAKFIERRSTEVGSLRAEIRRLATEKSELIKRLEIDSPVEAMREERQLERLRERDEALEVEDQKLAAEARFLQIVPQYVKPDQFDANEIRSVMIGDGVSEDATDNFLENLRYQDPALVIQLSQRAYLSKALKNLVPYTQQILKENEELKRKYESQGDNIARSISRELKKPASLQASRPVTRKVSETVNLSRLSDNELDEIINKGSLNGINSI